MRRGEREGATFVLQGLRITPIEEESVVRGPGWAFVSRRCVALRVADGAGERRIELMPGVAAARPAC